MQTQPLNIINIQTSFLIITGVNAHVSLQLTWFAECFAAFMAFVWHRLMGWCRGHIRVVEIMDSYMLFQVSDPFKCFTADLG